MSMSRCRVLLAALLASFVVGLAGVGPASSQAGAPAISISPTSGRIGTEITATITNCTAPPTAGGEARLDFAFEGFTPAATEFFTPAEDGTATVTIEATENEGQTEGLTAALVAVSQCGNEGFTSMPFTVTRASTDTTHPTPSTTIIAIPATPTTTVVEESESDTPTRSAPARPVRSRATFTG